MDLFIYQDLKYKEFNDKIINNKKYSTIGIRIPILRKLAKEMAKNGQIDYIYSNHTYYEEYLISGLIIGYLKKPFNEILDLLDKYIPYMKDWSMVDLPASNLKCFKNNLNEGYQYILKLLKQDTFKIRLGYVLLLDYYINDEYVDKIIDLILNDKNTEYYIVMSKAWLLSYIYLKYPKIIKDILKNKKLDKTLNNLTISKICDSYRVNIEDKQILKGYKI